MVGSHHRETSSGDAGSATLSLVDRFGTVLDSGRKIAAALSPAIIFREVRIAALHLLRGEHCIVVQVTQTDDGLHISGPDAEQKYHVELVENAIRNGRTIALQVDTSDSKQNAHVASEDSSTMCVPIFQRGRPIACLYVTHQHIRGLFGPDEERLADFIATIAGAALENAEGFQQLQALNETLEQRVADRTAAAELRAMELAESNAELERIARTSGNRGEPAGGDASCRSGQPCQEPVSGYHEPRDSDTDEWDLRHDRTGITHCP